MWEGEGVVAAVSDSMNQQHGGALKGWYVFFKCWLLAEVNADCCSFSPQGPMTCVGLAFTLS